MEKGKKELPEIPPLSPDSKSSQEDPKKTPEKVDPMNYHYYFFPCFSLKRKTFCPPLSNCVRKPPSPTSVLPVEKYKSRHVFFGCVYMC